jgi:hypothetical protein
MGRPAFRGMVSCVLAILFPFSLFAADGALNSPIAIGVAGAAALGITTWVLIQSDDPASPAKPK